MRFVLYITVGIGPVDKVEAKSSISVWDANCDIWQMLSTTTNICKHKNKNVFFLLPSTSSHHFMSFLPHSLFLLSRIISLFCVWITSFALFALSFVHHFSSLSLSTLLFHFPCHCALALIFLNLLFLFSSLHFSSPSCFLCQLARSPHCASNSHHLFRF